MRGPNQRCAELSETKILPKRFENDVLNDPLSNRCAESATDAESKPGSTKENRLLFVGRLASEKQIDQILLAWKTAHATLPNWKLRIVGQGPMEEQLKRYAIELRISDSIEWRGWTSDVWSEYRSARAFVMASRYEGFPQSLIEAMTMGLPCLVTNFSPAIGECIEHGKSGFLLQSISELPTYLMQLHDDPERELSMSNRAREMAQRYQWNNVAPRWEAALLAALNAK